ncbi:hypothetical protein BS50DRAFT_567295 [Corynespora cassiicola Philippines]|uniref:Uncharacterized protein n=1 Tax=Corynespora cassiicola Philippines TaxID=1448308 RepID=A0A2T2P9V5_CORCC|nr:hypothetical protein BS50DRAFT_567295 [Corynespora cassiicola Philippines]
MVDVAVSSQLQQWTFEKKPSLGHRSERSDSSTCSPDLYHNEAETLRIDAAAVNNAQNLDTKEPMTLQERYMSSEEDLSPMEGNSSDSEYDDDEEVTIHEVQQECLSARKMSVSHFSKGKSCDMAVTVSYVSAGRPKVIQLANAGSQSPPRPVAQRSASLAQLPMTSANKLRKQDQSARHSLAVSATTSRSPSPAMSYDSRRPSTGHAQLPFNHSTSNLHISDSASSFRTASSVRSASPSVSEISTRSVRPASAAATSHSQPRSSLYVVANAHHGMPGGPFPPLTPQSPEPHAFLSSDPYENSTTNAASPIIKQAPHRRLRSISQKLSLAKIAITPSTKKWDSRVNGKPNNMPPTPATPYTPVTPQTAPPTMNGSFASPKNRLRRNSKIQRPASVRGPSPDAPPVPTLIPDPQPRKRMHKMVARGAGEREPVIQIPPCPEDELPDRAASIKSRQIRKRKSLLDLL